MRDTFSSNLIAIERGEQHYKSRTCEDSGLAAEDPALCGVSNGVAAERAGKPWTWVRRGMILRPIRPPRLTHQSDIGDSAITGTNDVREQRVRRYPAGGDGSGAGSRLVAKCRQGRSSADASELPHRMSRSVFVSSLSGGLSSQNPRTCVRTTTTWNE
jgi:hypothetical protein